MAAAQRPRRLNELTTQDLPPFTEATVEWVRWSLGKLPPRNEGILTDVFYEELFVIAPAARALFAADMTPQKDRLLHALLAAANGMNQPGVVEQHLRRWGVSHRRDHGITDEMYIYVGQALVRTINRILGNDYSRVHSSWVAVYQWMAAVMIAAADEADLIHDDPSALTVQAQPLARLISLEYERGERAGGRRNPSRSPRRKRGRSGTG